MLSRECSSSRDLVDFLCSLAADNKWAAAARWECSLAQQQYTHTRVCATNKRAAMHVWYTSEFVVEVSLFRLSLTTYLGMTWWRVNGMSLSQSKQQPGSTTSSPLPPPSSSSSSFETSKGKYFSASLDGNRPPVQRRKM